MSEPQQMMPGQEPYTPEQLDRLHALVRDAAEGDPGEQDEPQAWCGYCGEALPGVRLAGWPENKNHFCSDECRRKFYS